ncbi:sensor histidine kinase [Actinomadura logoneensis]|nr:histidine kinase [Actinomadura logoneensis]
MTERVGEAFRMLMHIRMLTAAVTLLLIPRESLTVEAFLLVVFIVGLSWVSGRCWRSIAPRFAAHPLLFALDMAVSFGALAISGSVTGPFFLCTVVTAALGGLLYRWQGMLGVAALQMLFYYVVYAATASVSVAHTFQALLGQPFYYPLAGFAGVALRRLLDEYAEQEAARRRAEVHAAAADERARLAREMHDSLAKTLRGIALAASALPVWVERDAERAVAEARRIAEAAETASREARDLLTELRAEALVRPLSEVIAELAGRWSRETGTRVELDLDAALDLAPAARHEVVAILGEALTNVARHAGADLVEVRLSGAGDVLELAVRDDGCGFDPPELADLARDGHYGLVGLTERAERAGAEVALESAPGAGTTVLLRVPAERTDMPAERTAEVS